jgi:cytochrome bd-type quinol oxidase subunit 1
MANKEGHRAAKAAITCNAISLVLGIVLQFVVGPMTGKSLMDYLGKNQAQMEKNMSPSDKAKFEQNMKQFQDSMNKAKAQSGQ